MPYGSGTRSAAVIFRDLVAMVRTRARKKQDSVFNLIRPAAFVEVGEVRGTAFVSLMTAAVAGDDVAKVPGWTPLTVRAAHDEVTDILLEENSRAFQALQPLHNVSPTLYLQNICRRLHSSSDGHSSEEHLLLEGKDATSACRFDPKLEYVRILRQLLKRTSWSLTAT
jgi:hypothetical protein